MKNKLDIVHLKTYINANDALLKKLLTSFATNIPPQLQELKQFATENKHHETAEMAHKLKTPFLYFGLNTVAARLENIEQNVVSLDGAFVLDEVERIILIANDCTEQAHQEIERLS
ncbi:MAG: Hpt domain-containing protein [Sphingobacteriales bacterium JAD_PAG50586_3]|nr:MAG: Hpt domain-containing protein [Sphingobacteriales bacterium JAD_PAG50586_3]